MELLEENLGMKIKKTRKRIKIDSGSEDEGAAEEEAREDEELPDIDQGEGAGDGDGYESDDVNDFIVGDDGQPIQRERKKKKKHIFEDSARQAAEDIFGVAFDYDEFERYNDEEDYISEEEDEEEDEEDGEGEERPKKRRGKRKKPARTIFEMYEPHELALRHFTDQDNEIRNTDVPERMQLRDPPVTSVPDGSDELEQEAEWIYQHYFLKPTLSRQMEHRREDCREWERKPDIKDQIKVTLDFIRQQFHEVPFIAFYRKEYVPDLKINDLWRVYQYDGLWCKFAARRRNLKNLVEKMQTYQSEIIMQDPNAPLPEGFRVISNDDLKAIEEAETFEQLKDHDQHFKLYYGNDLEPMQDFFRKKRKEEKEARKLRKQLKQRKTKLVTNEEGEEVEVTDDEAQSDNEEDQEEDDESEVENEVLKQARRNDPYSIGRRYGLIGMASRFGLTAAQFAENLKDGYQKVDVEQEAPEPSEVAAGYINDKFSTAEDVLRASKFMVAMEFARNPTVRRVTRDAFYGRATVDVRPTKKGVKEIDENHDCYMMKYLKCKPVRDLENDQWLKLTQAEEQKLVEVRLGDSLPGVSSHQIFLEEAKELFKHDAFSKSVQEWNALRQEIVELTFTHMLFPMLRKELRLKLTKEAKEGIIRSCRRKLYDWIKTAKYTVAFEDEDEDDWDSSHGCRIMGIMYENDQEVASYAVALQADGEVGDLLKLEHLLKRRNSRFEKEAREKISDLDLLQKFIQKKRPHVIVVGAADRAAVGIKRDVEDIIKDLVDEVEFPKIEVNLLDDNLSRVYANSTRAQQDFRDYPGVLRQAISLARRMQDPLVEFSQLTGPENDILCLRYHPLQDLLSEEELLEGLVVEFINRTNEVGVDINECVAHPFTSNLVQFVGGLGPRKGAALLKTLRQMQSSQSRLENRQQLVTLCHMGPKVLINCAGFIKIDTSSLGDSEVYVEVLDGSRIHNEAYEWARKMAVDALEYDEDEGNPANALEEILQDPEKLTELDLDAFAQELERQGFGKKSITLQDIRQELHHMYKDLREPYQPPSEEEVFSMVTKETPETFHVGKLVQAQVIGFEYKKPQGEELDQAAPLRKGEGNLWQCPFCGQDDFPELTEVWNHFDAGTCPGKAVGVKVRLDNGVNGFISMRNLSDSTVLNPEERVKIGMNIFCRIVKIKTDRISVELVCKTSALVDKENEYKPMKDDYYDEVSETKDSEQEDEKKKQKQRQTYIKRVIVHPNFYNIGFKEAERLMSGMEQGEVIIRPSSKGEDRLTVTWKVLISTNFLFLHDQKILNVN